jgi:AcrR family transcriptional regulator
MRITAEAKAATRGRILEVANRLFREKGFDEAKIRDIAEEVGMATGTLFNYFASKEEVAVALAAEAVGKAGREFLRKRRQGGSLREDLFLQTATQLRCLKPLRKFFQPVIEAALSSPLDEGGSDARQRMRGEQLQAVAELLFEHGIDAQRWATAVPVYWALYVGVLTFWGRDKSPKQEETLAMLDQSINMLVTWLESGG